MWDHSLCIKWRNTDFFRIEPSDLEEAAGYLASQLFMTRELFKATTLRGWCSKGEHTLRHKAKHFLCLNIFSWVWKVITIHVSKKTHFILKWKMVLIPLIIIDYGNSLHFKNCYPWQKFFILNSTLLKNGQMTRTKQQNNYEEISSIKLSWLLFHRTVMLDSIF